MLRDRPELREFLEPMLAAGGGLSGDGAASESLDDPAQVPGRIGPYAIRGELGRGGMGIVYEAEHEQLGRRAAVKVLPELLSLSPRRISRFLREAKVAARLDHPGLARIHEVGEAAGTWWFAMDLVEGDTLRDRLLRAVELAAIDPADARLWVAGCDSRYEEAAEVGIQLAAALSHAHAHGLVHRDVKPQNIMVDDLGRLRLVDFGLAKDLEDQTLTRTGDYMGTPHYSAPEQVERGADDRIDGRADIFSVGAVLYEILTLRRPFDGRSTESILRAVVAEEPRAPTSVDTAVPKDLETIVLRALEKDPARRYQSAGELLEDLRRFRSGSPIASRPRSFASKAWRWARRHRGATTALLFAFGLFVVTPITAVIVLEDKRVELAAQRDAARRNFETANRAVDQLFTRIASSPLVGTAPLQAFRRALLEDARRFYLEFLSQVEGLQANDMAHEVALATMRVAIVDYELGSYADAASGFSEAIQRMAGLSVGERGQLELAGMHASRGLALAASGQAPRAEADYEVAERIWRAQAGTEQVLLAKAEHVRLIVARAKRDRLYNPGRALASLAEAIAMLDELRDAGFSAVMTSLDRGSAEALRALLLLRRGKVSEAAAALARAEAVYTAQPDLPRTRGLRSTTELVRAQLLQLQGKQKAAERLYRACWEDLAERVPQLDSPAVLIDSVCAADLYSRFLVGLGRYDEAFEVVRSVLPQAEQLGGQGNEPYEVRRVLAAVLSTTATSATFGTFDDVAAIDAWFVRAIAGYRELLEDRPANPALMCGLGGTLNNHAMRFLRREPKDRKRAVAMLTEAAGLQRSALQQQPNQRMYRSYLANHLGTLAPSLLILGRTKDAFAVLVEARDYFDGRAVRMVRNSAALVECARLLGGGGDSDDVRAQCREFALTDLERARDIDAKSVQGLRNDRRFARLRESARFQALTR